MAVTYYVALPFIRTDDGTAPGEAQECQSEAAAIRRAEGLQLLPAGAVAGWGLHPLENAALSRRTPTTNSTSPVVIAVARAMELASRPRLLCQSSAAGARNHLTKESPGGAVEPL